MKKHTGFTLIELMVLLGVVAVLFTVGLPQLSIFLKGNRMVSNTNDLLAGLNVARSEAIKVGGRVSICRSANAGSVPPACSAGAGNWEAGWFVWVDSDNTVGAYNSVSDGPVLRVNTGVSGSQVTITVPATDNIGNFVSFTSRGIPKTGNGAAQSGVFRICDDRGLKNTSNNVVARGVLLNASGRARSTKDATIIGACP